MAGKGRAHLDIKRAQGGARKGQQGVAPCYNALTEALVPMHVLTEYWHTISHVLNNQHVHLHLNRVPFPSDYSN